MLSGCAAWDRQHQQQAIEKPINVPAAVSVGTGQTLTVVAKATGVQIYTCGVGKNNSAGYAWNFTAPEADLFNADGKMIGKHYGGPTWEGNDGSKVVGQVKASDKGTDAHAITWLLLNAKSNSGEGMFAKTTIIQRLNTSGGNAPVDGCDLAHFGNEARVPYTGQYYFYN
jgi:hypothetical protein